jgi:hypothetical protein
LLAQVDALKKGLVLGSGATDQTMDTAALLKPGIET